MVLCGKQNSFSTFVRFKSTARDVGLVPVHDNTLRGIGERAVGNCKFAKFIVFDGIDTSGENTAVNGQLRHGGTIRITAIANHTGEMTDVGNLNTGVDGHIAALII